MIALLRAKQPRPDTSQHRIARERSNAKQE
ncbi:hypothetical protein TrRE_jg6784, partial [Triparma retinervis]